jgi:hypothetical protein
MTGTPWQPAPVVADTPCISHSPSRTSMASNRSGLPECEPRAGASSAA